ncbi:MAG: glucosamine-6-phosphate deaminase [Planctomycetes bacterium]|nr:glucosamine-6-phosphate deaminase [Planctomycetota bacterium]
MPTVLLTSAPVPTFVVDDPRDAALALADQVAALLARPQGCVLGLATGHTPILTYRELARRADEEGLSFARATTFNLDEYVGLAPTHPASFRSTMQRVLFDHVDLDAARAHLPHGDVPEEELAAECARYEAAIAAAGGIDLQLLGVGRNGHLAFNEPGSPRASRTRVVELSASTRAANRPDFPPGEEVPRRALTMGLGTILEARRLRVLAFGESKAEVVRRLFDEPVGRDLPASFLREHGDVELWLDAAAAGDLAG